MRLLYLDIDTLRPDHLSCYGYHRPTSPNIDRICADGVRFDNCYVSDAPCLPSRASGWLGRFGIHTGIINHGGTQADPMPEGPHRGFRQSARRAPFVQVLRNAGLHTVSVSPFAERHSAWWFYTGFSEMVNTGKGGLESAEEIVPTALDWLDRNAGRDNWFLHVNVWDPHTPFRAPMECGDPFADMPAPDWLSDELIRHHWNSYGPHSAREVSHYWPIDDPAHPRAVSQVRNRGDFARWINGYDTGIWYADLWAGRILEKLEQQGILEDTAIIVTSDHGENHGELGVYGDHQTADHITSRVPYILRWPGLTDGGRTDAALHYQTDIHATVLQLLGQDIPPEWDGEGFANSIPALNLDQVPGVADLPEVRGVAVPPKVRGVGASRSEAADRDPAPAVACAPSDANAASPHGRDFLVVSNNAWSCQRAVRWDKWILIRTYHTGYKAFPQYMLFDLEIDPHETTNLALERPDLVAEGTRRLESWTADMLRTADSPLDPMWNVIAEGGPLHAKDGSGEITAYMKRLRETGRGYYADWLEANGGKPIPEGADWAAALMPGQEGLWEPVESEE
jgi:arylsulfatase A-like enzyme